MRIRRSLGWIFVLLIALLIAVIALLPMRFAVDRLGFDESGLTARDATGTVWYGALHDVRFGPAMLGDVESRLSFFPLFLGRARLSLASTDPGGVRGKITVSRHGFAVDDLNGRVRFEQVTRAMLVPTLDFEGFSGSFASGRCVHAEGQVRGNVTLSVAGVNFATSLGGQTRCADDALLLPLIARNGRDRLNVLMYADGRYRLQLLVRPSDPRLRIPLFAAGFRPSGDDMALQVDGRF